MRQTFTAIELPSGEPVYQAYEDGYYIGIVRELPPGYCDRCGGEKPADQSCPCFDNGGE